MLDFDVPEIALITLRGLIALTIIVGLIDTVYAMLAAVGQGVFNAAYATAFLVDHAAKIWLPIIFLGILGTGITVLDVPPINVAYVAAQFGLAAYVVNTIKSLAVNTVSSRAPEG